MNLKLDVGAISERLTITAQGQPRPQPAVSSTALETPRPTAAPATFSSVSAEPPAPTGRPTRIRVGGNVRPAKVLASPQPAYPPHLVAQGVEGTVILDAVIGVDGQVLNVTPKNSQVHPDLVQAAVDSLKQWKYEPTLLNGRPVEVVTTVTCDFRLKP